MSPISACGTEASSRQSAPEVTEGKAFTLERQATRLLKRTQVWTGIATHLDVQSKLVGVVEDSLTLVALVNAAPFVRSHMVPQVVSLGEGCSTFLTDVRLQALV